MDQKSSAQDLAFTYLALRKAVGIIGVALPFVLPLGNRLLGYDAFQRSISHYYYTVMADVFVGSLCAIGVFLMSTKGYDRRDHVAGVLASIFAVGVALFPTSFDHSTLVGGIHLTFAALLFLTLAYFCLKLFVQTDQEKPGRQKCRRNFVYQVSGYTILASIALIAVAAIKPVDLLVRQFNPRFWLESAAIFAFGVAWLTKGEAILKDEKKQEPAQLAATTGQK